MSKATYDQGRECIIQEYIARFGEYKKIVRISTCVAYRLPYRIIIEQGIRAGSRLVPTLERR